MNCKNCNHPLSEGDKYCLECGAKVVAERLTMKRLWTEFVYSVFGWDNKYLKTAKCLIIQPEILFKDYISGVRKRYLSPFTYFSIGVTLALLLYSFNSKIYLENIGYITVKTGDKVESSIDSPEKAKNKPSEFNVNEFNDKLKKLLLKYYNIMAFLLLPVYALMAYWVFRKPYNYAEHLIINTYIQGLLVIGNLILFHVGLAINKPNMLNYSFFIAIIYYLYAYGRLYKLTFKQYIFRFIRFLLFSIVVGLALVLVGVVIGFLMKMADLF